MFRIIYLGPALNPLTFNFYYLIILPLHWRTDAPQWNVLAKQDWSTDVGAVCMAGWLIAYITHTCHYN